MVATRQEMGVDGAPESEELFLNPMIPFSWNFEQVKHGY